MDKVSVIIPFYNNKEWLEQAIESVEKQDYKPIEIIVINDGSSENINDIKSRHSNCIFLKKENEGAASARNYGLNMSTGKYIAFLDSDDTWDKYKISKQLAKMLDENKDWSVCPYKTFGEIKKSRIVEPPEPCRHLYDILRNSCKVQTSTVLVKRDVLINNKIQFPVEMKKGQDVYVWYRLAQLSNYSKIEQPLANFRIRGNNSYKNISNQIKARKIIWEKMNNKKDPLTLPTRKITTFSYKLCVKITNKFKRQLEKDNFVIKLIYALPWLLFRIDTALIKITEKNEK